MSTGSCGWAGRALQGRREGKRDMKIEIIEDDRLLGQALEIFLKKEGYETALARSCREARERLEPSVCLLLVDITLPDGDGIRLYRELTKSRPIPGIFLTARDEEEDMLAAFDAGADDYVVKPFPMQVLSRRIRAVLRRSEARQGQVLVCRELTLWPERKEASLAGQPLPLTPREYRLLELFMRNQGRVLGKESILEQVWDVDGRFVGEGTVSVTVNRLRKKIDTRPGQESYIQNVFGLGYRFGE